MISISIVVPVFKSANTLVELRKRLATVMSSYGWEKYEIIFVEDGSPDQSWNVICQLAQIDERVRGVKLARNFGQHNAILCGIRAASKDLIVTMDDDLQNPPEEIPRLVEELQKGFDVVYGKSEKQQHGLLRNLAVKITKFMLRRAMGAETAAKVGPFKIFKTSLRTAFQDFQGSHVSVDVLLTWATNRFSAISVRHDPRKIGASGYSLGKLIAHASNMMTGFSMVPLQLASITGFIFALFGLFILLFVLFKYYEEGRTVPGFTFLASIIAIFSGVQMFAIGIIGEYLIRIHYRTMGKPCYVIEEYTTPSNK